MSVRSIISGFVLALATVTASAIEAAECVRAIGAIPSLQGKAQVQASTTGFWRPAGLDERLCPGDVIHVGERGRAQLTIVNQPNVRLDQNTALSLPGDDQPLIVRLLYGAAYFFSRHPRRLTVDTPFIDAAVEGTEFLVKVEEDRTLIVVFAGRVRASNPQGELAIGDGEAAVAEAGRAPSPYLIARPRDAVQWTLFYPAILPALADPSGAAAQELPEPLRDAVAIAAAGQLPAAFARFEAIPETERGSDYYLYRAATLLSVGRVEDARADIAQALLRDPTDGRADALAAVIAVAQNDRERAVEEAQRAVELSPRSAAARIALSYAEQARFQIEAARQTLEQAVKDEPENVLAWARLSELWLMQGRRDRSRRAARRAGELAPELARTQTVLGFAELAEINTGRAKKAFRRAIEIDSANPLPRFGLGLATIRAGNLEGGRKEIEIAVALDPENALLRSYLGKAYFDERTTNPLTYFQELVTNFPNQENTLAAQQFAISKELDPNDPTPWLYNAIRLQSENRPVEALRNIEKSIELNDNRAVYRSRELLDEDQAARGTSLARIYNDLGFEQRGINEATKSLSYDPANAVAHRFLSDVYATQPRREIARASELLQAQLLQDININPVQPSLSETNLGIITTGGPARPGFNEFTPLFERNQAQLNLSGEVGSDDTRAEEAVVSGIYDWLSISAGQFHYQTDGFRRNFDLEHDVFDLFAQAAIAPGLNFQTELLQRSTEEGDRRLFFGSDIFSPLRRRDVDAVTGRAGLRLSPSPQSDILGSVIYSKYDQNIRETRQSKRTRAEDAFQGETRYLFRSELFNFTTGLSSSDVYQGDQTIGERRSAYAYSYVMWPQGITWTIGLSADEYQDGGFTVSKLSPKLGLQWQIGNDFRVRLAAFQSMRPALLSNRTIEPTQVAGFNQFFDDLDGTVSQSYGVGIDARLTHSLYGGLEITRRDQDEQLFIRDERFRTDRDEDQYRAYLYWALSPEWAVRSEVQLDVFDREFTGRGPTQVETVSLPLGLSYFHPSGFLATVGSTYIHQHIKQPFGKQPGQPGQGDDGFVIVDAAIGYRFPRQRGLFVLEVSNLFDSDFRYRDDSFREFRDEPIFSPFIPNSGVLARLSVNL